MDLPTAPRCLRLLRPAAALVCSAILYAAFLWPSTRYLADGIPYTAYNAETADARMLVPGDPLQLLYHFQLVRDMFAGRVPAFTNLYEFNLGDDAARRAFDPGYVPFSLLFAAASPIFGDAGAWNFTLFASVFTGFLLLLALARRFLGDEPSEIAVFVAAFVATCAPYRWVTLAGGSPTGFGMALIPAVALGVDMAVRDGRVRGGALAGVALVLCYATDLHSFLFATLALPLWCLVSWASASESPLPDRRRLLVLVKALLPLAAGVAVAGGIALLLRAQYAVTDAGGGRSLADIKLHSPVWQAIFDPSYPCHMAQHVNLGEGLPVAMAACGVLALGLAVFLLRRRRFRAPRLVGDVVCALLLAAAIVAALALALGTNGPLDALPLRALRKLVPPFALVRQPVKVFCLLPTFVAPFLVLSFGLARPFVSRRGLLEAAALISAALILVSSRAGMSAGTCLLPAAQPRLRGRRHCRRGARPHGPRPRPARLARRLGLVLPLPASRDRRGSANAQRLFTRQDRRLPRHRFSPLRARHPGDRRRRPARRATRVWRHGRDSPRGRLSREGQPIPGRSDSAPPSRASAPEAARAGPRHLVFRNPRRPARRRRQCRRDRAVLFRSGAMVAFRTA